MITNTETGKAATSHDTRRGFAIHMHNRGSTLTKLQAWMDHADIRTTLAFCRTTEPEELAANDWQRSGAEASVTLGGATPHSENVDE